MLSLVILEGSVLLQKIIAKPVLSKMKIVHSTFDKRNSHVFVYGI